MLLFSLIYCFEKFKYLLSKNTVCTFITDLTLCYKGAIMDFNGDLLTRCGKTYLRAFVLWITGMALSIMK